MMKRTDQPTHRHPDESRDSPLALRRRTCGRGNQSLVDTGWRRSALWPSAWASPLRASGRTARDSAACLALLVFSAAQGDDAQRPMRDPTVPPIALQAAPTATSAAAPGAAAAASVAASPHASSHPRHILVVDGQRYVIEAGRRRGVGETLGNARIERIEDSAIWVREAGTLQRLPMFGSAVRRAASPGDAGLAPPTTAQAPAPGGQPPSPILQPGEPS